MYLSKKTVTQFLFCYSHNLHSFIIQIGIRRYTFKYLLVLYGSDFLSWIFIKKFQTCLDVKNVINRCNLTSCQAHWVLHKRPLGGAKDEHISCFHGSCQWGLILNLAMIDFGSGNFVKCIQKPLSNKQCSLGCSNQGNVFVSGCKGIYIRFALTYLIKIRQSSVE